MPGTTAERRRSSDLQNQATLTEIHDLLLEQHGPQHWWPADSPFEVMVGAVLVQATSWANAERAIDNLKAAHSLSPAAVRRLPIGELETLVRPSGFFRGKARRMKALCEYLGERHDDDIEAMAAQPTDPLQEELLGILRDRSRDSGRHLAVRAPTSGLRSGCLHSQGVSPVGTGRRSARL